MNSIVKNSLIFFVLFGIALLARFIDFEALLTVSWIEQHISTQGMRGVGLFCLLTACLSACGAPRQLLAFAGGYAFGVTWGVLWTSLGLTAGCFLGLFLAKSIGRNRIHPEEYKYLQTIVAFLRYRPFFMAVIIRLFPAGNNALTNMIAGVSNIAPLSFILGSSIGYLPQTIIFVLLGGGMQVDTLWQHFLAALLFLFSSLLGLRLFRKFQQEQNDICL